MPQSVRKPGRRGRKPHSSLASTFGPQITSDSNPAVSGANSNASTSTAVSPSPSTPSMADTIAVRESSHAIQPPAAHMPLVPESACVPQGLSPPVTPPPSHLSDQSRVQSLDSSFHLTVMDNDVFAFYQDRPRSLSICTTASDVVDPTIVSPLMNSLPGAPMNSLSDHYAALSISLLKQKQISLGSQDAPTIRILKVDAEQSNPISTLPIAIGSTDESLSRSSSIAISAPSFRRRSRSILSTSPYPIHSPLAASLSIQPRSPKLSHLSSPQSLLAAPAGMVHKASVAASAPTQKTPYICVSCGKKYKHPNCLAKHKWEHTDYWKETSKLSISKHQQVQLLEAASVLIGFAVDPLQSSNSVDSKQTMEHGMGSPFATASNDDMDDETLDGDMDEASSSLDIDIEKLSDDGNDGLAAQALNIV
ncbi:hypothetical protein BDV3_006876 [Batrachochytrium dendrobatidis]